MKMSVIFYLIIEKFGKFLIGKTWPETLVRIILFVVISWFILDTLFRMLFDLIF